VKTFRSWLKLSKKLEFWSKPAEMCQIVVLFMWLVSFGSIVYLRYGDDADDAIFMEIS